MQKNGSTLLFEQRFDDNLVFNAILRLQKIDENSKAVCSITIKFGPKNKALEIYLNIGRFCRQMFTIY